MLRYSVYLLFWCKRHQMAVYTAAAVPGLPSAGRRGYVATSTAMYMCPHTDIYVSATRYIHPIMR